MNDHANCHVEAIEKPVDREALAASQVAFLTVQGMGCPRCAMRVHNGLLAVDGVLLVEVLLERGVAAVAYDPAQIKPSDLPQAVAEAGNDGRHHYRAELVKVLPAAEALVLE